MRVLVLSPLSLLLLLRSTSYTNAFTTGFCSLAVPNGIGLTSLFGKWAENDDYDSPSSSNPPRDSLSRNRARTDVRNFLTQRAIQSFVFLLEQCRDGHTASWIEVRFPRPQSQFLVHCLALEDMFHSLLFVCFVVVTVLQEAVEFKNMGNFHGTGGFNITKFPEWNSILNNMVTRPKETLVLRVQRRSNRRNKGWASNNYLDNMGGGGGASGTKKAEATKKPQALNKSPYRRSTGMAGSYLDNLGATSSSEGMDGEAKQSEPNAEKQASPPKKWGPPPAAKNSYRKGLAGNNYLNDLNAGVGAASPTTPISNAEPKLPRSENPHLEEVSA
jgi:hypothetical protein